MEIQKRFLTPRNELFWTENETLNTVDEIFMKADDSVQDLISEDNLSLTFISKLEKSVTISALGQKQNATEKQKKN